MDLNSPWIAVLAGCILGTLSGLGVGGGSLLILWLTLAAGIDAVTARGISLLFFFPAALLSCILRRRGIPWKRLFPAILLGCLSAGLFSRLSQIIDPTYFRKVMGIVLILTGISELFKKPKKTEGRTEP